MYGSGALYHNAAVYIYCICNILPKLVSSIRKHTQKPLTKNSYSFMQLLLVIALLSLTIALLLPHSKQNAVSEVMQKQDN